MVLPAFFSSPVFKTYVRAFFAVVLALFIADGADVFAVSLDDLRTWLAAGLAALGAVALKALDGNEPAFGRTNGSEAFEVLPADEV